MPLSAARHRTGAISVISFCLFALLGSAPAARAADMSLDQRKAIEGVVHDYLVNNPQVLLDALQAAEDKLKSDAKDKVAQSLIDRKKEVFNDPTSPVGGNPSGDITLVEFFDYRCPYCKQVQSDLQALIGADHQLRFVYKELPVLGPASVTAARAALAARKQGKYEAFHTAMMATKGQITDDTVYQVAGSVGLDLDRLKKDMAAPEVDQVLKSDLDLADSLDIRGTPAFVIGSEIVPGAIDMASLKQLIADARKKEHG